MRPPAPFMPDFEKTPFLILWELTRACDLVCQHCRAEAQPQAAPGELSFGECLGLLRQIKDMGCPLVVLTGGDPLKRQDVYGLISAGARLGLRMTMTPSGTPLLTEKAVEQLSTSGLSRMAVSLDGPGAESHDHFRGVQGSFDITWRAIEAAHKVKLPVQINTTFCRYNFDKFEALAEMVERSGAVLWSVFFVVPVGRAGFDAELTAEEFEVIFEKLSALSKRVKFDIKTTAAPHYRRYQLQHRSEESRRIVGLAQSEGWRAMRGVNDGNGLLFISHTGDVYPSGFLPVSGGNVREQPLEKIYRESELFQTLRNPDLLLGKCGACEFKKVCAGSRARAYAFSGDVMGEEPCCAYYPKGWEEKQAASI